MKKVLELKEVCKQYYQGGEYVPIIKNINLDIFEGEFISIMGPSGSGKSTLLYLMSLIEDTTSGEIIFRDEKINNKSDRYKSFTRLCYMGFIFQQYNLLENLNVEENILVPIYLQKKSIHKYNARLHELIEAVGLTGKEKYKPGQLSGGQQQRVAIARALINDPKIIFADEPVGNLDSKTASEVMKMLDNLNERYYITLIQVTHSDEYAKYGDRIITLKDGTIT